MPPDESLTRLAHTSPDWLGLVAVLSVLVPTGIWMARMLAKSLENNTAALMQLSAREDGRADRQFDVLRQYGEKCIGDHQTASAKLDAIAADVKAIRDSRGKA